MSEQATNESQALAMAGYDEVIQKYGNSKDPAEQVQVARALINKGITLHLMKRPLEALPLYDDALKRTEGNDERFRETAAKAKLQKANVLRDLNQNEAAIALCADLIKSVAAEAMPVPVAGAIFTMADTLSVLGKSDEALPLYDEVVQRFGSSTDPAVRPVVAGALFSKSMLLRFKARPQDALAAYDEIIKRFSDAPEPNLRSMAAMAQQSRAELLPLQR